MKLLRPKRIPQRTCIACRETRPKRELLRVVRTLTGEVQVDVTGKKAGRGAYLCRARYCWDMALKRRAIEHALQTQISLEGKAALTEFSRTLPDLLASGSQVTAAEDNSGAGKAP